MDGIKREIMFEKDWNQPCVHIDVPVPYEEDYQMKMLRYNEIDGLLRVSGIGREDESRYTYQTRGGISLEKKYENKNIEKETITAFIEQFMKAADAVRNHMLDPDCLLLGPEYVYVKEDRFGFCYLPVRQKSLYRAFHEMTEFFVRKLDYKDTEGIFLAYLLHRSTLQEDYDLREIMEKYRREAKERIAQCAEGEERKTEKSAVDSAVFTLEEESCDDTYAAEPGGRYKTGIDTSAVYEEEKSYGPIRKVIGRIKTGRWGSWNDLITEIDGQDERGHL